MIRTILLLLLTGIASPSMFAEEAAPHRLDWLSGCWQSVDGTTREVWSASEDGYYFGYSVVSKDGHAMFFEQMRIDPAPMPIFNAYPGGRGPSAFPAEDLADQSVTFANPEHDFPQKIRYWREDDALKALISRMDDTSPGAFEFVPCIAEPS